MNTISKWAMTILLTGEIQMLNTSRRWKLHGLSIRRVIPSEIFTMWATSVAAGSTVAVPPPNGLDDTCGPQKFGQAAADAREYS